MDFGFTCHKMIIKIVDKMAEDTQWRLDDGKVRKMDAYINALPREVLFNKINNILNHL
jgi:hypothetical protein